MYYIPDYHVGFNAGFRFLVTKVTPKWGREGVGTIFDAKQKANPKWGQVETSQNLEYKRPNLIYHSIQATHATSIVLALQKHH